MEGFSFKIMYYIISVGIVINSIELIQILKSKNNFWFVNWENTGYVTKYSIINQFLTELYSIKNLVPITILNIGLVLLSWIFYHPFLLSIVFMLNIMLYYKCKMGLDGSDQMTILVIITFLICNTYFISAQLQQVGLTFIASQVMLAYLVSGLAKIISKEWRNGLAIEGVLSTSIYGSSFTRKIVLNNRLIVLTISWATIFFEILFPFIFLLPFNYFLIMLIVGVLFHISIAFAMGLNDFVWSFVSTYPAIYFVYTCLH